MAESQEAKLRMSAGINKSRLQRDVDEGWAWVVLPMSAVVLFLMCLCYTGGIFNIIFLEEFNMSKQKTAWLTAVQGSLMSLTAPVGSVLVAKVGHRWTCMLGGAIGASGYFLTFFATEFVSLLFSFGILVGLGFGICYVVGVVVISEYFKKYRNVAFGVALGISGSGIVVLPMLIVEVVQYFGWRGSMLILTGLYMQCIVAGATFWPLPRKPRTLDTIEVVPNDKEIVKEQSSKHNTSDSTLELEHKEKVHLARTTDPREKNTDVELSEVHEDQTLMTGVPLVEFKSRSVSSIGSVVKSHKKPLSFMKRVDYILLCLSVFNNTSGTFITYIHFPAYFVSQGTREEDVAMCLMAIGLANIVCRLVGGVASNNKDFDVLLVYMVSCGIVAVLLFVCPLMAGSFTGQMTFCVLFGLYGNWVYSLLPPVTVHILDKDDLNMAFGVECFFGGIGGLIGPPVAGWLFDISGSYVYTFYTAGALYGLSLLLTMAIPIFSPKYRKMQENS